MALPQLINNLQTRIAANRLCTAFGIKLVPTTEIVAIAKAAGYDSLFIDLEHSVLSLSDASQLCIAGLSLGITPFVRVPHNCGNGFVQRVLDGGAMGVIFPHVSTAEEATKAVAMCKYPPTGHRSMTGTTPHFHFVPVPGSTLVPTLNNLGSSVFLMIETALALQNIEAIAAVPGYEVLLVGCNDLTAELGFHAQWDDPRFMEVMTRIGDAVRRNGRWLAVGGLYGRPDLAARLVKECGMRWLLGQQDVTCLSWGAGENMKVMRGIVGEE